MRNILLSILFILLIIPVLQAQNRNRQKIKVLKISYITDALELTEADAARFWPVYNDFTNRIQLLRKEQEAGINKEIMQSGGIDIISEDKANSLIQKLIELDRSISDTRIAMNKELLKIITAKQVLKLHRAERDFNREILREFGRRKGMQRQ